MNVTAIVVGLVLYLVGIIAVAIHFKWQSDIIGGLLTLPIEIVFIAALLDRLRSRREQIDWQPTRETLIDNTRALLENVLREISNLELVFNSEQLDKLVDQPARAAYAATWKPTVMNQAREWTIRYDAWHQSMQFSSGWLSPALARHMVAFDQWIRAYTTLYEHYQAIAENREKQRALGEIHTKGAALAWNLVKGVDDLFAVEGLDMIGREVAAAVNAWASCTALLGRMYEEVGYKRTVEESANKVVYTRGDKVHFFLLIGDGLMSSLVGLEKSLRGLHT